MTVRGGGRPRDSGDHLVGVDIDEEHYATAPEPVVYRRGRPAMGRAGGRPPQAPRGGGSFGLGGLVRLVLFIGVLAIIVLAVSLTVLRPVVAGAVVDWATDNPSALHLPFVEDLVREDLGAAMTDPVSSDAAQVEFSVLEGDSAASIAARLQEQDLLRDARAFVFIATDEELADKLEAGTYILRKNMTPDQLVTALLVSKDVAVSVGLREGLRLEQITAKLQTLPLTMDVKDFYDEVKKPPKELLADYPWLDLPKGASLEGYLAPATYRVAPDVTADELIRRMLDRFHETVGDERLKVPKDRGLTFYQVLTLASIVEREAVLDDERPLIAGVYQNRLDNAPFILNADPTVLYANDTIQLDEAEVRRLEGLRVLGAAWRLAQGVPGPTRAGRLPDIRLTRPAARADRHPDRGVDRRRAGAERQGRLLLLRGHPRRRRKARVREDLQGAPEEPDEVRLLMSGVGASSARRAGRLRRHRRAQPIAPAGRPPTESARPERLERLRVRLAAAGLDAYFGVRSEHARYLTGFVLGDGEDRVAGSSGWFLVTRDEVVLFADSRYRLQAEREAPDARIEPVYGDLETRWPELVRAARRSGGSGSRPRSSARRPGRSSATAAPDVELLAVDGLDRGRSGDQGAGRARADRRCLCGGGSGPGDAAARDPRRCDRTRARAAAGMADPDERRRRPRVRRRLPGRARGGAAARFAGRSAGPGRARSCCSTSGRRSTAIGAT